MMTMRRWLLADRSRLELRHLERHGDKRSHEGGLQLLHNVDGEKLRRLQHPQNK